MAQNAPNMKNLPRHQSYSCFLLSWWEKCIETSKKLIARVGTRHLLLGLHLPYGYQGKNAIFWLVSFLTPLIAWKTQTNIGKQLCISQCPTRGPKSSKIELLDQILAIWSDPESLKGWNEAWKITFWLYSHFFSILLVRWTQQPVKTYLPIKIPLWGHRECHFWPMGTGFRS